MPLIYFNFNSTAMFHHRFFICNRFGTDAVIIQHERKLLIPEQVMFKVHLCCFSRAFTLAISGLRSKWVHVNYSLKGDRETIERLSLSMGSSVSEAFLQHVSRRAMAVLHAERLHSYSEARR